MNRKVLLANLLSVSLLSSGYGQMREPYSNPAAVAAQRGAAAALYPNNPPANQDFNTGRWAWSRQFGWSWYPSSWQPPADPAERSRIVDLVVGEDELGNPIYRRVAIPPPQNYFRPRPGTFGY